MTTARELVQTFLRRRSASPGIALVNDKHEIAFEALALLADHYDGLTTHVTPVATTPRTALRARRSESVMRELIEGATEELIVLGYDVSDVLIIEALAERASLGVSVDLLVDSVQTPIERLADAWPAGAGQAKVWGTGTDTRGRPFRLHAKAIIADGRRCMLGSANLTHSGLRSNLELGVLLEGAVVPRFRAHVKEMAKRRIVVVAGLVGDGEAGSLGHRDTRGYGRV